MDMPSLGEKQSLLVFFHIYGIFFPLLFLPRLLSLKAGSDWQQELAVAFPGGSQISRSSWVPPILRESWAVDSLAQG